MNFRKIIFWIHLPVGILSGLVVLMMSLTGLILTYEWQLEEWSFRNYISAGTRDGRPLAVGMLLDNLAQVEPEVSVGSVIIRADPREPAAVSVGAGRLLFLDRYSGQVLGDNNSAVRRLLRKVRSIHRWFGLEGQYQVAGRTFTAVANLGFFFLIVSGVYLWWPRGCTRAAIRNATWFRRGLTSKARDFNWHNVIGFWLALPLIVIVFSGAMISYQWVGDLVYRVVGESPPLPRAVAQAEGTSEQLSSPRVGGRLPSLLTYDEAVVRAAGEMPDWNIMTLGVPEAGDSFLAVSVDRGSGRQPPKRLDLSFDRRSGELIGRDGYGFYSQGRRIRLWLRYAHTGEIYGVFGQTVAGMASAGSVVLVWTGLSLSWRRFFGPS